MTEMKNYNIVLIALVACFLMTGCHTVSKFVVKAPADTELYLSQEKTAYVTVPNTGSSTIKVNDYVYYGYMVARDKQSGLMVPFGLDFKHKIYGGDETLEAVGWTLAAIGVAGEIVGLVTICCDSESESNFGVIATSGGIGVAAIGAFSGGVGSSRRTQLSHKYKFAYVKTQSVSFDGLSTTLLHPDPEKQSDARPVVQKKGRTASSPAGSHGTSTVSRKRNAGSSSVRGGKRGGTTPPDVSGVYRGFGSLTLDGVTDEVYDAITIEIARADKDQVRVKVIESGEEYFETPMMFTVTGNGRNGSKLTSDDIEGVVIEINQKGEMVYRHPRVNIDGADYVLTIVADRE